MSELPHLFDRDLIRHRLIRAARGEMATFPIDWAAGELVERLSAVKRAFACAAEVGSSSRLVAERLSAGGQVAAISSVDLFVAMGDGLVDGPPLPFAPASLDLVVSAFALQAVNDLPGLLVQMRRALKPDGLLLAALAGGETLSELRQSLMLAEADTVGGASPRVAPFVDVRAAGGLLQRAGFALPITDVDRLTVRYADPLALMADLRRMGATNPLVGRRRVPLRRETLARALAIYRERFADPDGRVRATLEVVWLSGWAPAASQPKPLKPGSATARLADALGTVEHKAGDTTGGQES